MKMRTQSDKRKYLKKCILIFFHIDQILRVSECIYLIPIQSFLKYHKSELLVHRFCPEHHTPLSGPPVFQDTILSNFQGNNIH